MGSDGNSLRGKKEASRWRREKDDRAWRASILTEIRKRIPQDGLVTDQADSSESGKRCVALEFGGWLLDSQQMRMRPCRSEIMDCHCHFGAPILLMLDLRLRLDFQRWASHFLKLLRVYTVIL